jgi:hypothetical protein
MLENKKGGFEASLKSKLYIEIILPMSFFLRLKNPQL